MGGRGSCYLNFNNSSNSTSGDINLFDIFENAEDDLDTLKEYNGKTEKLKEKNIHIKQSTDKMPEDMFIPNIKKIDHLTRKYIDTANILKTTQQEMAIRSDKLNNSTIACFVSSPQDFSVLQIVLNKDLKFNNKHRVEKETKEQIESGYWIQSDKNELVNHTITHEFGHYVQRVLLEQEHNTQDGREKFENLKQKLKKCKLSETKHLIREYSENFATKVFKDIQRIHRKEFGREDVNDISLYGRENNREAFAELFTNLNCCKNPSTLAQAMGIYLDKKMEVRQPSNKELDKDTNKK